jgi:hypothetical protein
MTTGTSSSTQLYAISFNLINLMYNIQFLTFNFNLQHIRQSHDTYPKIQQNIYIIIFTNMDSCQLNNSIMRVHIQINHTKMITFINICSGMYNKNKY